MFSSATEGFRQASRRAGSPPPWLGESQTTEVSDHPAVVKLRRRATVELFDWLGLSRVPGQFWTILDTLKDPVEALEEFVRHIGCNFELVRQRAPEEIEKVETIISFLTEAEDLFAKLTDPQRRELHRRLFTGQYREVVKLAQLFADLQDINNKAERTSLSPTIKAFESFVRTVQELVDRPQEVTAEEVEGAKRTFNEVVERVNRFRGLRERYAEFDAESIRPWLPTDWPDERLGELSAAAATAERICEGLENDPHLNPGDIELLLRSFAENIETMERLRAEAHAWRRAGADADDDANYTHSRGARPYLSPRDEALIFYGFAPGSHPSAKERIEARRKLLKENNPTYDLPEEERKRREKNLKEANIHWPEIDPRRGR